MSQPMNRPDSADAALGRRLRAGPSIRPAGLACLFLAVGLLAAGLYRGELAATLCGFSLLVFLLVSFIGVVCGALWWRGRLVSSCRKGEDTVSVRVSIPDASRLSALFFAMADYLVPYSTAPGTSGARAFTLRIPLEYSETEGRFERPSRGYYLPERPRILIRDYTGFFSWSIPQRGAPSAEPVPVYPEPEKGSRIRLPPGKTGLLTGKSTFNRSEELHETRQYHPGDDPRRINWKVYAHSGSLSVREGELMPPPSAEYVFIVNSTNPRPRSSFSREDRDELFDILINRAASLALDLFRSNHIVTILTKTQNSPVRKISIEPEHPKGEEAILAEFSIPQTDGGFVSAQDIIKELSPQAVVLFFTLPDASPAAIRETFMTVRDGRLRAYAGPMLFSVERDRPLFTLLNLLYRDIPLRGSRPAALLNALAGEFCLSLEREGIHAQTV